MKRLPKKLFFILVLFSFTSLLAQSLTNNIENNTNRLNKDTLLLIYPEYDSSKFLYIQFFTTWCSTCKFEMKYMNKIFHDCTNKVQFLSISIDKYKEDFDRYAKKNKYPWKFLYLESTINLRKKYNILAVPTFILFDKDLNIINHDYEMPSDGIELLFEKLQ